MIAAANMVSGARARRRVAIVLVLTACALALEGSVAHAASEVRYQDGKLWLAVDDTPAAAVFATVSERTGMTIVMPDGMAAKLVSVRAAGLPVETAIERLLREVGHSSYVLIYERDGQARRLVIFDRASEPSRHGESAPVTAVEAGRSVRQQIDRWKTLNQAERHQVRERLQQLPPAERVELTLYYRRHVLGLPIDEK